MKLSEFTCEDCIYKREGSETDYCHESVERKTIVYTKGCSKGRWVIRMVKFKAEKNDPPVYVVDWDWIAKAIVDKEEFVKIKWEKFI